MPGIADGTRMTIPQILFYVFAAFLAVGGLGVITARNPVHAALFLVFSFVTSAAIWLLLEAEFLAIVLVLVYVGAVMVLFLFVVMMLDVNLAQLREGFTRYAPLGFLIAAIVVVEIGSVVWVKSLGGIAAAAPSPSAQVENYSNTRVLGDLLYTDYLYPFELAAVILLVAIVAAIVLTMRQRAGLKAQDIAAQVAVRAKDRIRIIKMNAETSAPAQGTSDATVPPGGQS
jgi:NADH-quinone oxidoreductase subunit J